MDRDVLDQFEALEARVRGLEDELSLLRLMTSYGPAVDTGDGAAAAQIFVEDGVYDADGPGEMAGRGAIEAMLMADGHQALVPGCVDINGPAMVSIDGDHATAVGYSQVFSTSDGQHRQFRMAANRWEFTRTPAGWRVTRRTNRVLGTLPSLDILRSALDQ